MKRSEGCGQFYYKRIRSPFFELQVCERSIKVCSECGESIFGKGMPKHWVREHEHIYLQFNMKKGFYLKENELPRNPLPLWVDVLFVLLKVTYGCSWGSHHQYQYYRDLLEYACRERGIKLDSITEVSSKMFTSHKRFIWVLDLLRERQQKLIYDAEESDEEPSSD